MTTQVSNRLRIYINNVNIKGFKSIQDLIIDFQPGLNILIGKNGSGKSNFMECMFLITRLNRDNKIPCNYAKLEYVSNDNHSFILELERELNIRFSKDDDIDDRIEIIQKLTIDNNIVFDNSSEDEAKKTFFFNGKKVTYRGAIRSLFLRLGYPNLYPLYIKFDLPDNLECISSPGIFKLNNDSLYSWTYPNTLGFLNEVFWSLENYFEDDESNEAQKVKDITISNILDYFKINEEIIENLKIYTTIEDVRFNHNINLYKDENTLIIENIKLEFRLNNNWLPWSQLSDGTKRLFYIIAEVTFSGGLVLLEEPELGIHPHQFSLLMDFLKEESRDKQIILSTHSPKALDHLDKTELDSILITNYDIKKGTQIRHLSSKEIIKAKRYMKEVGFFSDYWMLSDLE